jgi:ribosomal protein S12 methylthiotransferase
VTSVAFVTLGCARNDVDSEQLGGLLARSGYRLVDDVRDAEVVVVNTCTFIDPATQESVETVLDACDLKGDGTDAVIVVGCMAQRYGDELAAALPEADAVVGFDAYPQLATIVGEVLARGGTGAGDPLAGGPASAGRATNRLPLVPSAVPVPTPGPDPVPIAGPAAAQIAAPSPYPTRSPTPGPGSGRSGSGQDDLDRIPATGPRFPVRATPEDRPWAYLKIASGCDRACTFCAIPSWRGRFRSRPAAEIVAEARWLVSRGARELVLVSENTTSWGRDLPGGARRNQPALLRELADVAGLERVRLMYLQPAELLPELLSAMVEIETVAPYFDLSLQHASADVLQRMARSGSRERFVQLIERIRELEPEAVFRSNFIVGFPGETDRDAAELVAFLAEAQLDWVGLFAFSPQEGTVAASLPGAVPPDVVAERLGEASEIQEAVADTAARRFVGRRLTLTVEGSDAAGTWGRSYREAPETDGEIRLVPPGRSLGAGAGDALVVPVGRSLRVDVVGAEGVDLLAVPAARPDLPLAGAAAQWTDG